MEVRDLEILRILQETRNITHAADRLYMAQSAVSKRVKAIERELGVVLLLRSRHGVRFTPAGEAVLRYEKAAGSQLEQLHQELSRLQQGAAEGTLRVGAVTPYALGRLPPALAAYKKCAPAVAVQVVTGTNRDLQQQMLDGTLDLAVTTAECRWDGPRYFLPQEPFCLAYAAPTRRARSRSRRIFRTRWNPPRKAWSGFGCTKTTCRTRAVPAPWTWPSAGNWFAAGSAGPFCPAAWSPKGPALPRWGFPVGRRFAFPWRFYRNGMWRSCRRYSSSSQYCAKEGRRHAIGRVVAGAGPARGPGQPAKGTACRVSPPPWSGLP